MAGEWIKIEAATADKPEVLRMARILKIDRDAVFGKLTRLWAWFDSNSVDGVVDGVVDADIDRLCHCDGFAAACSMVSWLVIDADAERMTIPNFDRHNGETAKQRAMKSRRQAKWRAGVDAPVDVDASTTASTREEKRREDKSKSTTPVSPSAKPKSGKLTFEQWNSALGDDEAITADDPIFAWAETAGVPHDFMHLAWLAFDDRYTGNPKRYSDWRAVFRNAVKGNWLKVWWAPPDGGCALTTVGEQMRRIRDAGPIEAAA